MATPAEIEAAAAAIRDAMPGLWSETWPWQTAARAALDAAERVRPRETSTERTRRHRAKRRAAGNVPTNVPSAGNVPKADGGNVSSPARLIDNACAYGLKIEIEPHRFDV